MTPAESELAKLADVTEGLRRDEWFAGAPTHCDYCKCSFAERDFFVDGMERDSLMWGFMCAECFDAKGKGIRWGQGQLYQKQEKQESGEWLCVAGWRPEDDEEEVGEEEAAAMLDWLKNNL